MPYVQIVTNVSAPVEQNAFHADIAEAMALLPDVEKDWTMTSLAVDSGLRYEGSNAPAAIAKVYVYGPVLDAGCQQVTRCITEILNQTLAIPLPRIYVAYFRAQYWGSGGSNY